MHGFQLWVNLPSREKMTPPRYQEIPADRIPVARSEDGRVTVRVLAGNSLGQHAVIETKTPILYLDVALQPGAHFRQSVPRNFNVFAYVVEGRARFASGKEAEPHELVLLRDDGDEVEISAPSDSSARLLLIGGVPLNEPVARYGPFVMNTRQELIQAFEDFQSGRLGEIR